MFHLRNPMWSCFSFFEIKSVVIKIMIIWLVLTGVAQRTSMSTESTDFEIQLQFAIEQAQSELNAEKARIQNELQIREDELQQILQESRRLSEEIVECKISIAQKQKDLRQIRKQRETLWAEQTQFQEDVAQIKSLCQDVETELTEMMDMLPMSENRKDQRRQLETLKESITPEKFDVMVSSVFKVVESVLDESRSSSIYSTDIIDRQGQTRSVQMLRIGQSLFAYHIPGTSRAALAVSDPYQGGGFRWYESLDKNMQKAIIDTVRHAENHLAVYTLPIDVTGTMTAQTSLTGKSLSERFGSGGIVMYPLVLVALLLLILIIERFFVLLHERRHSLQFCEQILELCNKGDFVKAENMAQKRKGIVSRILKICLVNRHQSPSILDDTIQEAFLHELPRLERFLPLIKMLSSVAPMLGLLGTVTGIIATFDMITIVGGGKPQLLAGGIAEALITTATGLAIAIPGLLAHSFLSSRIEGLIADAERFAAGLSNILKQKQSESVSTGENINVNT